MITGCSLCMFFKSLKLTGYLHRNEFHKSKCEYVDRILVFLVVQCILEIVLCVVALFKMLLDDGALNLLNFESIWNLFLMVAYVIVIIYGEFFIGVFLLRNKFVAFFKETMNFHERDTNYGDSNLVSDRDLLETIREDSKESQFENTFLLNSAGQLDTNAIDIKSSINVNSRKKARSQYKKLNENVKKKELQYPFNSQKEENLLKSKTVDIQIQSPFLENSNTITPKNEVNVIMNKSVNKKKKNDHFFAESVGSTSDNEALSCNLSKTSKAKSLTEDIILSKSRNIENFSRKNGLGIVYFTKIRNTVMTVREINCQMTSYILNEIPNELKRLSEISIPGVEVYKAQTKINKKLLLISNHDESMMTLSDF